MNIESQVTDTDTDVVTDVDTDVDVDVDIDTDVDVTDTLTVTAVGSPLHGTATIKYPFGEGTPRRDAPPTPGRAWLKQRRRGRRHDTRQGRECGCGGAAANGDLWNQARVGLLDQVEDECCCS